MNTADGQKYGFWETVARKAKSILDDGEMAEKCETLGSSELPIPDKPVTDERKNSHRSQKRRQKRDGPALQKGFDALATSLSYIGGTIGNAVEEGLTIIENRASEIIEETRKHVGTRPSSFKGRNFKESEHMKNSENQVALQTEEEIQLKASRDVAMAMATKAKLLLRELKTAKADLAFAKERCAQLEEENKIIRENREMGNGLDDEDLVRLQLETLLREKSRLAHENSVYSRENHFLREVVEYHQLTMQDVIYLDERAEEINEVYPPKAPFVSKFPSTATATATAAPFTALSPVSSRSPPGMNLDGSGSVLRELLPPEKPAQGATASGS